MSALRRWLICIALALLAASSGLGIAPVVAQDTGAASELQVDPNAIEIANSDQWFILVDRAEETIANGRASDDALFALRSELDDWRNRLSQAREVNDTRIRTVSAQIDALGDPPAEGESESASVAELRSALTSRLDLLLVPRRQADVAYNRADALIAEIDQILRERQAAELFEHVASPLWPTVWARSANELGRALFTLRNEVRQIWTNPATAALAKERMPLMAALLLFGFVLLFVGRRVAERLTSRVHRRSTAAASLVSFLTSLLQIIVPVIGLMAMFTAGYLVLSVGTLTDGLLIGLFVASGLAIAGRWLATTLFPRHAEGEGGVPLSQEDRGRGRQIATALGIVFGLAAALMIVADARNISDETNSFLGFPLILMAAFLFWRLAILVRTVGQAFGSKEGDDGSPESSLISRMMWILGRALLVLAIAGPVAGLLGYWKMANYFVFPGIASLGVFGVIAILHSVYRDFYSLAMRTDHSASKQALLPVLATFATSLASIPLLALIWGALWTDIVDTWAFLKEGVRIGDARIGFDAVLTMAIVFAVGVAFTRLLQSTLRSAVLPRTTLDIGGQNAISAGIGYVGIGIAAIVSITVAGVDLSGFALLASALSVGIGFGLQTIVSNFVSGLILLAERPISEGDWIEVGGQMGIVKDVSVRATRIETFDRTDVIIPNSDLIAGTVTNWTRGNTIGRVILSVGVAYGSDSKRVEEILHEIAEAHPLVSINPPPKVFFRRFGPDALEFDVFCILRDVNFKLQVHSDLNHAVHQRFVEEGIEIPFAQRDVWLRNPEDLHGVAPDKKSTRLAPGQQAGPARMQAPQADPPDATDSDAD